VIQDFALFSLTGTDTTAEILSQTGQYLFLFAKDFEGKRPMWQSDFEKVLISARQKNISLFLVSNMEKQTQLFFNVQHHFGVPVLGCDGTVMKTFLRSDVGLVLMNGPIVEKKWNIRDVDEFLK
jgi:hypothetical protein